MLGLYEFSRASAPSLAIVVKWPCGCSATGTTMRSMEHANCSRHERVRPRAAYAGNRRKHPPYDQGGAAPPER